MTLSRPRRSADESAAPKRSVWFGCGIALVAAPFLLLAGLIATCGVWYGVVTIAVRSGVLPNPFEDLNQIFEPLPPPAEARLEGIEFRHRPLEPAGRDGWVNFYGSDAAIEQTVEHYVSLAKSGGWNIELRFSSTAGAEEYWFSPSERPDDVIEDPFCIALSPVTAAYNDATIVLDAETRTRLTAYAHPYLLDLRRCSFGAS